MHVNLRKLTLHPIALIWAGNQIQKKQNKKQSYTSIWSCYRL